MYYNYNYVQLLYEYLKKYFEPPIDIVSLPVTAEEMGLKILVFVTLGSDVT